VSDKLTEGNDDHQGRIKTFLSFVPFCVNFSARAERRALPAWILQNHDNPVHEKI